MGAHILGPLSAHAAPDRIERRNCIHTPLSRAPDSNRLAFLLGEHLCATLHALFPGIIRVRANLVTLRSIGVRAIPCPCLNYRTAQSNKSSQGTSTE